MNKKLNMHELSFDRIGKALHRSMEVAVENEMRGFKNVIERGTRSLEKIVNDPVVSAAHQLAEAALLALQKCQFGVGAMKAKEALELALNNAHYWGDEENEPKE